MTYQPCPIQQRTLKTWYPKNHKLHNDPLHPLVGLAGEAGELLNLWKKNEYKPGFKATREQWLDELGDLLYYLAIALYQCQIPVASMHLVSGWPVLNDIAKLDRIAAEILDLYLEETLSWPIKSRMLIEAMHLVTVITSNFYCTLDELSKMNREKLKDGKHGWPESDGGEYDKV
jgi:NTP pyrophosphatase (non-canonical NTP hydrolase)